MIPCGNSFMLSVPTRYYPYLLLHHQIGVFHLALITTTPPDWSIHLALITTAPPDWNIPSDSHPRHELPPGPPG